MTGVARRLRSALQVRLPLRVRLTIIFAIAMSVVLVSGGLVLYQHLAASLNDTLDQTLHARTADITTLLKQADSTTPEGALPNSSDQSGNGFVQILDAQGGIVDQSRDITGSRRFLNSAQLAAARSKPVLVYRTLAGDDPIRLLASPVRIHRRSLIVVIGAPLETHDQTLSGLRRELLLGSPIALLLASIIGYLVAAAALRPVDRMRIRASTISDRHLTERLPVSGTGDEISRLGETLNAMLDRIESGIRREREFLADASHELRTPLSLLRAEVELALEAPRTKPELLAALRSVGEETDRLSELADALLLLNQIDDGSLPIRRDPVALGELMTGIATRHQRRADELGRRLEVEQTARRMNIDRLRLEQALGNLVQNALRHGSGTVRLFAVERDQALEIHVTDEGSGLPADFIPRAFDRFSRPSTSRSGSGAGLGLAIVQAIAEAHGGTAIATSTSAGGADIYLSLPLADASVGSEIATAAPSPA